MIRLTDISKVYRTGDVPIYALRSISLEIQDGEFVAIIGPSGSGKSTVMNIIGCLDVPSAGKYYLDGYEVSTLGDNALATIRNRKIGFVFQSFNLLPRLTAVEQVEVPLTYRGTRNRRRIAKQALADVGLANRIHHRPTQLSGGEQQRVAIARAIVGRPSILLADEPTGALDTATSVEIMRIFESLNRELGMTVVFVTHDMEVADHTRRIVRLRDGQIVGDEANFPRPIPAPEPVGQAVGGMEPF
ncbi:MAG: ABC transporter ATP-binding protein [Dehalococcoidia bacterium]|nr:ABC transporter ATP-binding protein [Dehalococcoidia bacterium]